MRHCGIDVHQTTSDLCEISSRGKVLQRDHFKTSDREFRRRFEGVERMRVLLESGGSSPWIARLLGELGHEVILANPRRIGWVAESTLKTDRIDAEILARVARSGDRALLRPAYLRSEEGQRLRTRLRVRTSLVRARTALINQVRGTLRAEGVPMASCASAVFVVRFAQLRGVAKSLREILEPLVATIGEITAHILAQQVALEELSHSDELLERFQEVPGVGALVSVSYLGWMDRAERFRRSRDVGAGLGLRPSLRESGQQKRVGSISREGDGDMRSLLVQAAHAALRVRKDSALRRWATRLEKRAGKRKTVVALARKIAVLLHRLWVTGEHYQPFPHTA